MRTSLILILQIESLTISRGLNSQLIQLKCDSLNLLFIFLFTYYISNKSLPQAKMDVVVKGYTGLLDCLESYATACEATLVVMGSQALTSQTMISGTVSSAAVVGSVTLSCVKRLAGVPMLVVTANTRLVQVRDPGDGLYNGEDSSVEAEWVRAFI